MREAAHAFLARECPPDAVRKIDAAPDGFSRVLWNKTCELGWPALGAPASSGGIGGLVELCLVAEEMGRAALSSPLLGHAVATRSIASAGDGDARRKFLAPLLSGETIATLAVLDERSRSVRSRVAMRGVRSGADWVLSGTKTLVPWASVAGLFVVAADLDGRGESLVVIERGAPGVSVVPQQTLGGERRARIAFDRVVVEAADVLPGEARPQLDRALDAAAAVQSAHAVGLCEGALALSVKHASTREQFGRPIGSFQAIAFRCVDMRLAIDGARALAHRAAWAIDEGRPSALHAAAAKAHADEMVELVTANAHQVHGAIGFSTEYDLHLYTTRARAFAQNHGSRALHLERVAAELEL